MRITFKLTTTSVSTLPKPMLNCWSVRMGGPGRNSGRATANYGHIERSYYYSPTPSNKWWFLLSTIENSLDNVRWTTLTQKYITDLFSLYMFIEFFLPPSWLLDFLLFWTFSLSSELSRVDCINNPKLSIKFMLHD